MNDCHGGASNHRSACLRVYAEASGKQRIFAAATKKQTGTRFPLFTLPGRNAPRILFFHGLIATYADASSSCPASCQRA